MELNQQIYTLEELAELFKVKHTTLASAVSKRPNSLPKPIKVGRQLRFTRVSIERFINDQLL
ncbi:TPA: helix-turn-helix domain-containing protein [Vibrio parahaemolyticus]|nr:helix-turn-helix domain-containing protein [Vibrio parahaemolyticus]HCH5494717.1 helix-turn-helix domain-containing protein [Vibrio parahaemolyticus]HCH6275976.1 helix-turn-helix domain-containing protein [Vibrio parahaemolyticus]HCH6312399.1 helix-turn-helix domain-containing protein [Vibrio parahaemolyticus]HCH6482985.1 helix-turn-helix domain-containing protein [Vibrio parahaemolyticus]